MHAIERVRLVARLKDVLPSKFVRKLAADGEQRRIDLGFTSKNLREGKQIAVGPLSVEFGGPSDELFGWDWQRLSAANSPVETLVLADQVLAYETSQYTRWKDFIDRFSSVALPTLTEVLNVIDLSNLSLEYFDRFVFDGEPTEARPDQLIPSVAEQLHPSAADGREPWHLHRGWFEETDGLRLLVNQNLDAQEGHRQDGSPARSVQIFTKTELRPGRDGFDLANLRPHLNMMHDRSIELFKAVLLPNFHEKVGLEGDTVE